MRNIFLPILAATLASCAPAKPDIAVSDAWARATAPGQSNAAIYATIANTGAADQLVGVATGAGMAMLHANESKGGVARMRMIAAVPVPAQGRVSLTPGGTHVMLTGLKAPLAAGTQFPMTLRFAASGERTVDVSVVAAGER